MEEVLSVLFSPHPQGLAWCLAQAWMETFSPDYLKSKHWVGQKSLLGFFCKMLQKHLFGKPNTQAILKEINPENSSEGLMWKLKPQYFKLWCKELTHWKRAWCWERLKAAWEGDDRGWDGWMASLTWWIWVWASSRNWWEAWSAVVHGVTESDTTERLSWYWFGNHTLITVLYF